MKKGEQEGSGVRAGGGREVMLTLLLYKLSKLVLTGDVDRKETDDSSKSDRFWEGDGIN